MAIDWNSATTALPGRGERVWVGSYDKEGKLVGGVGKRVVGTNGDRWIDDNSLPIHNVQCWAYIVLPDETQA